MTENSPAHVLVIDDEPIILNTLVRFLGKKSLHITGFQHWQEAEKNMQENAEPISLIITDYQMPGISGEKWLETIRELAPKARIIVLSGDTDQIQVKKDGEEPICDIIEKPVRLEYLWSRIVPLLSGLSQ